MELSNASRCRWAVAGSAVCALLLFAGSPPAASPTQGEARSGPAARYLPAEGLLGCFEFDGMGNHERAWQQTAAYAVLTQTSTGEMLKSLVSQLSNAALASNPNAPVSADQLSRATDHVLKRGLAVGISMPEAGAAFPLVTIALNGGGEPAVKDALERVLRAAIPEGGVSQVVTRQDGRKLVVVRGGDGSPPWCFWYEGNDLIVLIGTDESGADRVVAAASDPSKSAAGNAIRQALAPATDGFEPVMWGWFDGAALPATPPELGLANLKRIDFRWGFKGKELVGITRVIAPSPRTGLLSLLDQPSIDRNNMPPLPAGLKDYAVASIDLGRVYDVGVELITKLAPDGKQQVEQMTTAFKQQSGLDLRGDVLAALGPRWGFYVEPRTVSAPLTPIDMLVSWLAKMPPAVAVAEVRDAGKLKTALEALARVANPMLAASGQSSGHPITLDALAHPELGVRLSVPPQLFPLPTSVDPGLMYNSKYVAISNALSGPRHALALAGGKGERLLPDAAYMPKGLVYLEAHDPRELTPELIANLPFFVQLLGKTGAQGPFEPNQADNPLSSIVIDRKLIPDPDAIRALLFPGSTVATIDDQGLTVTTRDSIPSLSLTNSFPVAAALLLPAIQSARQAAQRAQSVNNLKQIVLAMHNYATSNNDKFPDDIRDADGKPLLSWRVAILPFIEQTALYQQFHLDEAWDSPHNKALLATMPSSYAAPGDRSNSPPGYTFYQALRGDGAIFDKDKAAALAEITDGTSNTIIAVEAAEAVPWTKPADVEFDPEKDVPALGGLKWAGGFNAAFADGSVRFLKESLDMMVLKALITRAGGEVVSADDFLP